MEALSKISVDVVLKQGVSHAVCEKIEEYKAVFEYKYVFSLNKFVEFTLHKVGGDFDDGEDVNEPLMNETVPRCLVRIDGFNYDMGVDGALEMMDLVKESSKVEIVIPMMMKDGKSPVNVKKPEDMMTPAMPEPKFQADTKHSMPPPTGTFLNK